MQPRTSPAAGALSNDVLVANMAQDILGALPAPLAREDASIARDPFAPLPTGLLANQAMTHFLPLRSAMHNTLPF